MSLNLKELAEELDDLIARRDDEDQDDPLDEDEQERLKALESFAEKLGGDLHTASRRYTLIAESDFKDYAEETAYNIGMCERDSALACYVDWDRWAKDLKSDYTVFEFDGETYYTIDY